MNAVEIRNLTVSYRENVALKGISLNIEEGTFLSVIGPNGAGKTTLLTAINGLGRILSGTVKVFGMYMTPRNAVRIRKRIGYVPQNLSIDPRFPITVEEVVKLGRFGKVGLFRRLTKQDDDIVHHAMELTGVLELRDRPIGHLSGGEQQKVSLARVVAQQPELMLLDEPTSNLDPKAQEEIVGLIDKIYNENHITVVFVTHILTHIPRSCRQVVLMKHGTILWAGDIQQLDDKLLYELYDHPMGPLTINR